MPSLPSRTRSRGFTLVELMVVVALVAGVAGMGVWTLSGSTRVQQTAALARGVHAALLRARAEAVGDGTQRRLLCTATSCRLQIAATAGMAAPAAWRDDGWFVTAGTQTQVWAIDGKTDVTSASPAGPLAGTGTVTFFPDGTATAATVFLTDVNGVRRFKVFVFPATGMARVVDSW